MSEEKPTFKVTDRRLFNADGTPRENAERPAPEPAADVTSGADEIPSTAATSTGDAAPPPPPPPADFANDAHAPAMTPPADDTTGGGGGGGPRSGRAGHGGGSAEAGEAGDPNAFGELVMALAQPAAMALGMIEHPAMAGRELDPLLAKHYIDLLGTLQQKTNGNLSPQEDQLLKGLLTELRMQYVSISGARPGSGLASGGFTGSDITGGR